MRRGRRRRTLTRRLPAVPLVEPAGATVLLEYPEKRLRVAALAPARNRLVVQPLRNAAPPGLRQDVEAMELAFLEQCEPEQPPLALVRQHDDARFADLRRDPDRTASSGKG